MFQVEWAQVSSEAGEGISTIISFLQKKSATDKACNFSQIFTL